MPLPTPIPGLVIHYSYLWRDQWRRGLEEGTKERPCVIAAVTPSGQSTVTVYVVPLTHQAPSRPSNHIEVPLIIKRHLGLDDDPSWFITNDLNRFRWPGPDLRPIPGKSRGTFSYGVLPPRLFRQVRDGILVHARSGTKATER